MRLFTNLVIACFAIGVIDSKSAVAQEQVVRSSRTQELQVSKELIVLIRPTAKRLPSKARDIVSAVDNRSSNGQNALALTLLGQPIKARYLLTSIRLSDDALAAFAVDSPDERMHRYVILEYETPETAGHALGNLKKDDEVQFVGNNHVYSLSWSPSQPLPNDPFVGLGPSPQTYQWGIHAMTLPSAWDTTRGAGYVAVIDNGISPNNPDLKNRVSKNIVWNVVHDDANVDERHYPRPIEDGFISRAGHGTHVAGIIAADTNNSLGISGVCPNCSVMIAKIADYTDEGNTDPTPATLADGIFAGTVVGAQSINLSLGMLAVSGATFPNCLVTPAEPVCNAIAVAASRETMIFAAAGNFNCIGDLDFPARDYRVVPVGAITSGGTRWSESGNGSCSIDSLGVGSSTGTNMLNRGLVGPGKSVLSTWYAGFDWTVDNTCPGNFPGASEDYATCTGTSMATPHIAGLSVLARSINPQLTSQQVLSILRNSGSNANNPNSEVGAGIPNAYTAVSQAKSNLNRLTPLYSFWNATNKNRFYTIFPQMGTAARTGYLFPNGGTNAPYGVVGTSVNGSLASFPETPVVNVRSPKPGCFRPMSIHFPLKSYSR